MPDPSAPPATEKPAATAAENERLLAEVAGLKKKLADLEAAKKADEEEELGKEAENFAEGLIKQGRLAPKHKGTIVVTLKTLAADSSLSFGEGKNKKPMVEVFQEFLGDMPHVVSFGEIATKDRASAKGGSVNQLLADAEARLQKFSK